jgi:hypothetical protein
MTIFKMAAVVLAVVFASGSANALQFSFTGTSQSVTVKNNDLNLGLNNTTLDFISGDKKTASNGLFLSGAGVLTFTYLGFEAGNSNYSARNGSNLFVNGVSAFNATITSFQAAAGLVDFAFGTTFPDSAVGVIMNNGVADPASKNYAIGYRKLSDTSYYVLFDDIASGDRDFDDIGMRIDVAPVPVPAAGLLLVSVMGGIAVLRRRYGAA